MRYMQVDQAGSCHDDARVDVRRIQRRRCGARSCLQGNPLGLQLDRVLWRRSSWPGGFDGGSGGLVGGGQVGGIDWVSTLAPTVGYAFDRWPVYGKAGGAWIHASAGVDITGFDSISANGTTSGWMVGIGAEYALRDNWTVSAGVFR
jgi:opacity protein-like surface antigen